MKKFNTKGIVFLAVLTAISVILGRLLVIPITNELRISFINVPIILASLWFGPIPGMLVGAASDILGTTMLSPFPWYPPLTVTPVLFGLLPSLLKRFIFKKKRFLDFFAVILITNFFGTMCWSTYALSRMSGISFISLFPIRIGLYIVIAVLETVCIYYLTKSGLEDFIFKRQDRWYKK